MYKGKICIVKSDPLDAHLVLENKDNVPVEFYRFEGNSAQDVSEKFDAHKKEKHLGQVFEVHTWREREGYYITEGWVAKAAN